MQPKVLIGGLVMLKEFKSFLLRGNVVDLAVAVAIGASFTAVVNSLVSDIITPLIAAVGGKPDFSNMSFTINHSVFAYGQFLNTVFAFLIMASVLFFFVVKPVNHLTNLANRGKVKAETKNPEIALLEEIRDELRKK
jgi:large conductance mechanosensitive channel